MNAGQKEQTNKYCKCNANDFISLSGHRVKDIISVNTDIKVSEMSDRN